LEEVKSPLFLDGGGNDFPNESFGVADIESLNKDVQQTQDYPCQPFVHNAQETNSINYSLSHALNNIPKK